MPVHEQHRRDERWPAQRPLELVPHVPTATWGRDELPFGDMGNSSSLTSWLLACSGHDMSSFHPPTGGRARGWAAGMKAAKERSTWPPRLPRSLNRESTATRRTP